MLRSLCAKPFLLSLVLSCLACACDSGEDRGSGGAGQAQPGVPEAVEDNLWAGGYYSGGDWEPDYNDGNFYGTAFYVRQGLEQGNAEYLERAREDAATESALDWLDSTVITTSRRLTSARSEAATQELLDIVAGGRKRLHDDLS